MNTRILTAASAITALALKPGVEPKQLESICVFLPAGDLVRAFQVSKTSGGKMVVKVGEKQVTVVMKDKTMAVIHENHADRPWAKRFLS